MSGALPPSGESPAEGPEPALATTPAHANERIAGLDALRGLAVAGIAVMNVFVFAMPSRAYSDPGAWGEAGALDLALWALGFIFVEDKFRAVFAMLFGAGVAIQFARLQERRLRRHFARMAVLFAIGMAHAVLLANNDILRLYALCGLVLPFVMAWSLRMLLGVSIAITVAYTAAGACFAWDWMEYWWEARFGGSDDPVALREAELAYADPNALERALVRGSESLGERVERRLGNLAGPLQTALAAFPATLAQMLTGIALWRAGLLAGRWSNARALRLAAWCAALAIPPLALLAGAALLLGTPAVIMRYNAYVWTIPFDILLSIGWTALAMALFCRSERKHGLTARLAAAGRMALTNYVGTSLVFAAIFASWGLARFPMTDRAATYAVALVPVGLMLVISPLWLARFRQGPLEWLWRGVAQARFTPLRR